MATGTLTSLDGLFKILYPQGTVETAVYKEHALLQMLPTTYKSRGKRLDISVIGSGGGGVSSSASTAITNNQVMDEVSFQVPHKTRYAVSRLGGVAIELSADDGSLAPIMKTTVDTRLAELRTALAIDLMDDGYGHIGQVSAGSTVGSTSITLADTEEGIKFNIGDVLTAHATQGATARSGTVTLTGVNREAGTLTAATDFDANIAAIATGDYLSRSGDVNAVVQGIPAWLPASAPTSGESFLGVDRSVDAVRYAGVRATATGESPDDAIQLLLSKIGKHGGTPNCVVVGPDTYRELSVTLSSQQRYNGDAKKTGHVGFGYLAFSSNSGDCKIVMERFCPDNVAYGLTTDSWQIACRRQLPHVVNNDGLIWQRISTDDVFEMRLRAIWAIYCTAPWMNGRVSW